MTHDSTATQDAATPLAQTGDGTAATTSVDITVATPVLPATLAEAMDRLDVEAARRLQAEEALREIEERFRQLSEHAGKFLWMSDPQTDELIYVSPGYEEVWVRSRESSYASPRDWTSNFRGGRRGGLQTGEQGEVYQV
ncbi:MAG TPA: hypothetical protein VK530_09945, partial [Candidatus Acidoferrum sp.]|nr:hypothetical protein [Candidatus Acidoferrum sp.]